MDITVIPLSQLQTDPQKVLSECLDSGRPVVVQLPDQRLVSIQPLEPEDGEDSLIDDLLAHNPSFRALIEKSRSSPRKDFLADCEG
jgi:hypothetical protein